ncbi:MAG: hypothetical protein KAT65_27880, partial [Methanophagales archaeon]|nr:hypothetical protein [Methanophagales archaeon]
ILTLLIVGGGGIWKSSDLNEYIEGKRYNLEFNLITSDFNSSSGEMIRINGFVFYYDFTQNKGNISFNLDDKTRSIDYMDIYFPSVVDTNTLQIYTMKNGNKMNVDLNLEPLQCPGYSIGHNYTRLTLSDFERTFYDETFVIEFESTNLKPKGRFGFRALDTDKNFLCSSVVNVNFVLGDDYECRGACVYDLHYIEETPNSFDRNLQLAFMNEEANGPRSFKLNAISRKILFKKSLLLGLGIAFLAAGISFVLERWYKYLREKDG